MKNNMNAAAYAAAKPGVRIAPPKPVMSDWKPDPCLLTRRELKALIAEELG